MTTATSTQTYGGSQVIAALEHAWRQLQQAAPDLPDVVIITGSGMAAGGCWGYSWADRWGDGEADEHGIIKLNGDRKTEIFMAGERFAFGPVLTFQTLAHEATHALGSARGIATTSDMGRYHNRKFVELSGTFGLTYKDEKAAKRIGFSGVELTDEAKVTYAEVIDELGAAIKLYLEVPEIFRPASTGGDQGDGTTGTVTVTTLPKAPRGSGRTAGRSTNLPVAVCSCDEPIKIRLAKKVIERGIVRCDACGELFTVKDSAETQ